MEIGKLFTEGSQHGDTPLFVIQQHVFLEIRHVANVVTADFKAYMCRVVWLNTVYERMSLNQNSLSALQLLGTQQDTKPHATARCWTTIIIITVEAYHYNWW